MTNFSLFRDFDYAVSISTKGEKRVEMLNKTIEAFLNQTKKPKEIIITNNNDFPLVLNYDVTILENKYDVKGDVHGQQNVLEFVVRNRDYPLIAKWDDDLIPEPDCMEKLLRLFSIDGVVATGGFYPNVHTLGLIFSSLKGSGDTNPRHLQFFEWNDVHMILETNHIYSSFLYNVEIANIIGGFCTDYSQYSYRAETDFTLRMSKKGQLLLDTEAKAIHHVSQDGIRGIPDYEKNKMIQHDLLLFQRRMEEEGIDWNY